MSRRGSIAIYISFIFIAIIVVVIATVFVPMGTLVSTKFYAAGEDILLMANDSIMAINDADVRSALLNSSQEALDSTEDNIEFGNSIYQYSWIIVILLAGLVAFLFTRRLVEYGGGGFV